jgi:hypothetical protein
MLIAARNVSGLRGSRRREARTSRQGGFLIHRQDDLVLWGGTAPGTAAGGVSEAIQVLGEKPLGPLADDGLLRTNGLSHVGLGGPSDQQ